MIVNDNDIYTLGIPHSGEGFIYRKNGTSVIERKTGYAFGRLHIDAGKICFAFCQPVTTSSGNSDSFYMARNGVTTPVWFSKETSRVWDLMSHDGQTCALVSAGPWNTMELIDGEEEKSSSCRMEPKCCLADCLLQAVPSGQKVCIHMEETDFSAEYGSTAVSICFSRQDLPCPQ